MFPSCLEGDGMYNKQVLIEEMMEKHVKGDVRAFTAEYISPWLDSPVVPGRTYWPRVGLIK